MKTIVICGATATGKSDLAVDLAKEIGAEIINADSMQLYRGMDIGTAKLKVAERRNIAHHMLDVLDVTEDSTVAWYQERARSAIAEIHGRGLHAVIVGGTGLYIKAILDDLNFPDTDARPGDIVDVKITEASAHYLLADAISVTRTRGGDAHQARTAPASTTLGMPKVRA